MIPVKDRIPGLSTRALKLLKDIYLTKKVERTEQNLADGLLIEKQGLCKFKDDKWELVDGLFTDLEYWVIEDLIAEREHFEVGEKIKNEARR